MVRIRTRDISEAEDLLAEVAARDEDKIAALPRFYEETARKYRRLSNRGEREDTSTR